MNRIHEKFCSRNPSFIQRNGKVSVLGHSLGSVIVYDILSLWDIELRNLTGDATTGTGFLTESLQYLRTVTGGSNQVEPENAADKEKGNRRQNLRIELSKARSQVMRLEAMIKSEVVHGLHSTESNSSQHCPLALRFKVPQTIVVLLCSTCGIWMPLCCLSGYFCRY